MRILLHLNFLILFMLIFMGIAAIMSVSYAQTAAQDIKQAETYLRGLDTVKADFIQTAYNGSRLSGKFYLDRPGKLRFEYNEVDDFIVADGVFIYFYDAEMGEQTNAPIGQTLADFLLRKDLKLGGDLVVNKISTENGMRTFVLSEAGNEGAGTVKLFFQQEPYALRKWQVTDAAGMTTEVLLRNVQRDVKLPASLFAYIKPKGDKPRYNQ
jgi:outer membrane lipoprotein-sorting protein